MKKISLLLAIALVIGSALYAQEEGKTLKIKVTKTVNGKTTTTEEKITLKEGEDIEKAVEKYEKDLQKDEETAKDVKVVIEVKGNKEGSSTQSSSSSIRTEDSKENGRNRKEVRVIIQEEKTEKK